MESQTGAGALVRALESLGVDTVFGIPGIHNLDVYDELLDSRLRHVTSRNEAGAAFMADGYARGTGRPGVALVISGPGVTNALTALGESRHDAVPVVLISSDIPRAAAGGPTGYLHQLDHPTTMSSSVTKLSVRVEDPTRIAETLAFLYTEAATGRPGPVHMEVPIDVLQEAVNPGAPAALDDLVGMVRSAQRPVVIAGGGAVGASASVVALAERISAPVVTTAAGKGVIADAHPLSLGGRLHVPSVRASVEEADLVMVLGSQLSSTDLWTDRLAPAGRVVAVNADAAHLPAAGGPAWAHRGDLATVLPALLAALEHDGGAEDARGGDAVGRRTATERTVQALRERSALELPATLGVPVGTIERMRTVLQAISTALGPDGVLTADMTSIAYCGISEYPVATAGGYLHPAGFGTLGFALPAAIGALQRSPRRPVAALVGDGGFQFTMQEFAVAVQENIPLPVIVWNDGGYGEIRREEERRHPGRRIAVDTVAPDFCAFAASYGATAERVSDLDSLGGLIADALTRNGPTLLEVPAS